MKAEVDDSNWIEVANFEADCEDAEVSVSLARGDRARFVQDNIQNDSTTAGENCQPRIKKCMVSVIAVN